MRLGEMGSGWARVSWLGGAGRGKAMCGLTRQGYQGEKNECGKCSSWRRF